MPQHPERIIDLHTHLFNARYLPLESIIADAMRLDESLLARVTAKFLYAITSSRHHESVTAQLEEIQTARASEETFLDAIWHITENELLDEAKVPSAEPSGSPEIKAALERMASSRLGAIISELEAADRVEPEAPDLELDPTSPVALATAGDVASYLAAAKSIVKRVLRKVTRLMDPRAWGEPVDYVRFFFTLLGSEETVLARLRKGYGAGLPPLQFVHHMMDMQMAYPKEVAPYYPPYPDQQDRMARVAADADGQIFGFWAFDPRRDDWRTWANEARRKGFIGFKFYPAMGYKPVDNPDSIREQVVEFFNYCNSEQLPIFAHCTPDGFQTKEKKGENAHPKYWRRALECWPELRLCLGHAGGGRGTNGTSAGWESSEAEWKDENCYARIVAELCRQYPNVYCDIGYLNFVLTDDGRKRFRANLARARELPVESDKYDFLTKVAFGTDWHMPSMVDDTREYLEAFLEIFDTREYGEFRERFFWRNARSFMFPPRVTEGPG